VPLIFVLHGGGGNGVGMESLTRRGFNRIADAEGAVIVYPDGIGKGWNDGRTDLKSKATQEHVDDVGFLRALPRAIGTKFSIDERRVYITGISNGGLMSYRMACDAADVFAAAGPVAANMSVQLAPICKPARPIPVAIIEGTEDPIMPWQGGTIRVLGFGHGNVISTEETFARWLSLDKCKKPRERGPVNAVASDDTSVLEHNAACADGTEVRLYEIQGGGHTWPSGVPYLGKHIVGRVSEELDGNQVLWDFFKQYSLPPP
jgi:polyhydroxybutyrate depolymerase